MGAWWGDAVAARLVCLVHARVGVCSVGAVLRPLQRSLVATATDDRPLTLPLPAHPNTPPRHLLHFHLLSHPNAPSHARLLTSAAVAILVAEHFHFYGEGEWTSFDKLFVYTVIILNFSQVGREARTHSHRSLQSSCTHARTHA